MTEYRDKKQTTTLGTYSGKARKVPRLLTRYALEHRVSFRIDEANPTVRNQFLIEEPDRFDSVLRSPVITFDPYQTYNRSLVWKNYDPNYTPFIWEKEGEFYVEDGDDPTIVYVVEEEEEEEEEEEPDPEQEKNSPALVSIVCTSPWETTLVLDYPAIPEIWQGDGSVEDGGAEEDDGLLFTITLTGGYDKFLIEGEDEEDSSSLTPLTLSLSLSGTATYNEDYTLTLSTPDTESEVSMSVEEGETAEDGSAVWTVTLSIPSSYIKQNKELDDEDYAEETIIKLYAIPIVDEFSSLEEDETITLTVISNVPEESEGEEGESEQSKGVEGDGEDGEEELHPYLASPEMGAATGLIIENEAPVVSISVTSPYPMPTDTEGVALHPHPIIPEGYGEPLEYRFMVQWGRFFAPTGQSSPYFPINFLIHGTATYGKGEVDEEGSALIEDADYTMEDKAPVDVEEEQTNELLPYWSSIKLTPEQIEDVVNAQPSIENPQAAGNLYLPWAWIEPQLEVESDGAVSGSVEVVIPVEVLSDEDSGEDVEEIVFTLSNGSYITPFQSQATALIEGGGYKFKVLQETTIEGFNDDVLLSATNYFQRGIVNTGLGYLAILECYDDWTFLFETELGNVTHDWNEVWVPSVDGSTPGLQYKGGNTLWHEHLFGNVSTTLIKDEVYIYDTLVADFVNDVYATTEIELHPRSAYARIGVYTREPGDFSGNLDILNSLDPVALERGDGAINFLYWFTGNRLETLQSYGEQFALLPSRLAETSLYQNHPYQLIKEAEFRDGTPLDLVTGNVKLEFTIDPIIRLNSNLVYIDKDGEYIDPRFIHENTINPYTYSIVEEYTLRQNVYTMNIDGMTKWMGAVEVKNEYYATSSYNEVIATFPAPPGDPLYDEDGVLIDPAPSTGAPPVNLPTERIGVWSATISYSRQSVPYTPFYADPSHAIQITTTYSGNKIATITNYVYYTSYLNGSWLEHNFELDELAGYLREKRGYVLHQESIYEEKDVKAIVLGVSCAVYDVITKNETSFADEDTVIQYHTDNNIYVSLFGGEPWSLTPPTATVNGYGYGFTSTESIDTYCRYDASTFLVSKDGFAVVAKEAEVDSSMMLDVYDIYLADRASKWWTDLPITTLIIEDKPIFLFLVKDSVYKSYAGVVVGIDLDSLQIEVSVDMMSEAEDYFCGLDEWDGVTWIVSEENGVQSIMDWFESRNNLYIVEDGATTHLELAVSKAPTEVEEQAEWRADIYRFNPTLLKWERRENGVSALSELSTVSPYISYHP